MHLWDLKGQEILCSKMLMLLDNKPGAMILGRQVGSEQPGEKVHITNKSGLMYRHDPNTFRQMWARVISHEGDISKDGLLQSGSYGKWVVEAWFEDNPPSETQPVNEWLHKVGQGTEGGTGNGQDTLLPGSVKTAFLIWKIQRVE